MSKQAHQTDSLLGFSTDVYCIFSLYGRVHLGFCRDWGMAVFSGFLP